MERSFLVMFIVLLAVGLPTYAKISRSKGPKPLKLAHKGEDKWSHPENWEDLVDDYEFLNGCRCHTDAQCSPGRWCSNWGWCQGTADYYLIPNKRAFVVTACSSSAGRIKYDSDIITAEELARRCKSYYAGCSVRLSQCSKK